MSKLTLHSLLGTFYQWMATHPCLWGHSYLALLLPCSFQFYFITKKPPTSPPKNGCDFSYELVRPSEFKLFMVMLVRGLSLSKLIEPHFEVNWTPNLNAAPQSPVCSLAAVMELLLTMEKCELGNGQKILLSRKKNPQTSGVHVMFVSESVAWLLPNRLLPFPNPQGEICLVNFNRVTHPVAAQMSNTIISAH